MQRVTRGVDGLTQGSDDDGDHTLLDHPSRSALLETLAAKPGMNKNQLRLELDLGLKVIDHHLARLLEEGLLLKLESAQDQEYLYFLPKDRELWDNPRTRILYGREPARHVALFVAENPGCASYDIAEAVDLTVVTVRHHLRTLLDHQIIVRGKVGRRTEYHPLNELISWSRDHGGRYPAPWRDEEQ